MANSLLETSPDADAAEELRTYRNRAPELQRVADLLHLIPAGVESALDIGARDGHISRLMAATIPSVTALDLKRPQFTHPGVICAEGDAANLAFADRSIDLVLCAEVLEHLPSPALEAACAEMARVAKKFVLVGVPHKQDIRRDKTTCYTCGKVNPPWGHVNSFDRRRLGALFPSMTVRAISLVGTGGPATNAVSSALMNFAGNPFGTYDQAEGCIGCGSKLSAPPARTLAQKIATRLAVMLDRGQAALSPPRSNWIHILFAA